MKFLLLTDFEYGDKILVGFGNQGYTYAEVLNDTQKDSFFSKKEEIKYTRLQSSVFPSKKVDETPEEIYEMLNKKENV